MTALLPDSLKNGEYGVLFTIGHAIKNAHVRLGRLVSLNPPRRRTAITPGLCGPFGPRPDALEPSARHRSCIDRLEAFQPAARIA
jgi:hypothetical protein